MLSTALPILAGLATAVGLWQVYLRWRAFGTDEVRTMAVELRVYFQDVVTRGGLGMSEFLTGDGHTVEERLRDWHDRLHDRELQGRVGHLADRWRTTFAYAPPQPTPGPVLADGSVDFRRSPEDQRIADLQVETARDGLVEVEGVLERCNDLERLVVGS